MIDRVTVTRIYRFEAAHQLEGWDGPAARIHGHSYTVRVECTGGYPTERLDSIWDLGAAKLDHVLLNEIVDDTTVEGLAAFLLRQLTAERVPVVSVEVQEGELRFGRAIA